MNIIQEELHNDATNTTYQNLSNDEKMEVAMHTNKMCKAIIFITQADRKHFGKLQGDFENSYTRGRNDYPKDLVSAYQMLNKFKQYQPKAAVPEVSGVAFSQKGQKDS